MKAEDRRPTTGFVLHFGSWILNGHRWNKYGLARPIFVSLNRCHLDWLDWFLIGYFVLVFLKDRSWVIKFINIDKIRGTFDRWVDGSDAGELVSFQFNQYSGCWRSFRRSRQGSDERLKRRTVKYKASSRTRTRSSPTRGTWCREWIRAAAAREWGNIRTCRQPGWVMTTARVYFHVKKLAFQHHSMDNRGGMMDGGRDGEARRYRVGYLLFYWLETLTFSAEFSLLVLTLVIIFDAYLTLPFLCFTELLSCENLTVAVSASVHVQHARSYGRRKLRRCGQIQSKPTTKSGLKLIENGFLTAPLHCRFHVSRSFYLAKTSWSWQWQ